MTKYDSLDTSFDFPPLSSPSKTKPESDYVRKDWSISTSSNGYHARGREEEDLLEEQEEAKAREEIAAEIQFPRGPSQTAKQTELSTQTRSFQTPTFSQTGYGNPVIYVPGTPRPDPNPSPKRSKQASQRTQEGELLSKPSDGVTRTTTAGMSSPKSPNKRKGDKTKGAKEEEAKDRAQLKTDGSEASLQVEKRRT